MRLVSCQSPIHCVLHCFSHFQEVATCCEHELGYQQKKLKKKEAFVPQQSKLTVFFSCL